MDSIQLWQARTSSSNLLGQIKIDIWRGRKREDCRRRTGCRRLDFYHWPKICIERKGIYTTQRSYTTGLEQESEGYLTERDRTKNVSESHSRINHFSPRIYFFFPFFFYKCMLKLRSWQLEFAHRKFEVATTRIWVLKFAESSYKSANTHYIAP